MVQFKLFDKWDTSKIVVEDHGLKAYISLNQILVPKSAGRNRQRFWKSKSNIVERLMNKL